MNNSLIEILRNNLDSLIETGKLQGKYIVLFGMNTPGDEVINYLSRKGISVSSIIDNNVLNKGKKLAGVYVYRPDEILGKYREDAVVLICSRYFSEMKKQLQGMGYDGETQIFKVLEMNSGNRYTTDLKVFEEEKHKLYSAAVFYNELKDRYGEDVELLVSPVKANGDVYIISTMIKSYMAQCKDRNIKFAVVGGVCRRIAKMFGIEEVIQITQEEMEKLVFLSRFLGRDKIKIEIIQPYYVYTSICSRIEGYKGLNFMDFFRYGYMNKAEVMNSIISDYQGELADNENTYGLVKGKTFILAPYANSLPQIEWKMWEKIVEILKDKGYKVFTNSASDDEAAIQGTEKIFFPIEDTVRVLNYAGGFMAMRNGLCEVASLSDCRQIIIYPDKAAGYGKVKDAYGIKAMGLNDKVIEFEDSDNLLSEICECVENL